MQKYTVAIPKDYFHPTRWPQGVGEYIRCHVVEATSREEAAAKVWGRYGAGYLLAMVPRESRLPRKVSVFVLGDTGTPPGRLSPICVFTGFGPLDEKVE